jgi:hypothetical protein
VASFPQRDSTGDFTGIQTIYMYNTTKWKLPQQA